MLIKPVVAKFEKISFNQFYKDWLKHCPSDKKTWTESEVKTIYDTITLPTRGTNGSAGYDISIPYDVVINFNESKVIPTGLRCKIDPSWFLDLNPRSGQGFKYGIRLANTRGIIDSDYYNADNEGHIMVKLANESKAVNPEEKPFKIEANKAFCQGIFTIYGITEDDNPATVYRTGGFGSTDNTWQYLIVFDIILM